MNPFARYRYINAEEIIKANIRPNHITEDAASLLNALTSITYIANQESQKAASLHRNVIQKLISKPNTLEILKRLGYRLNGQGDYVYEGTSAPDEMTNREKAADEFQRFFNDLKKIKAGTLNDFEEYIENVSSRPQTPRNDNRDDDYYIHEERQERLPSRVSVRSSSPPPPRARIRLPSPPSRASIRSSSSPPRMPDFHTVQRDNEKTSETVRSFKKNIVPEHGGTPVHSFIRRKLLFSLFQQEYPDSIEFDDQTIDEDIDRRISQLKHRNRNHHADHSDEVYYECLIRANLNEEKAFEMLRNNPPNLTRPEPEKSREPTTTTLDNSLQCVQHQWRLLNNNADENGGDHILIHEGDEWKNTMHIVTAITQIRKQDFSQQVNERMINKMYRLIYSELSRIVGPQSALKVEIVADALCEVSSDSLKYLKMADIRDILRSCSDTNIHENFRDNVIRFLSTECPICGGSYPQSYMERMFLCDHTCCLDCAKHYYRQAVTEIKDDKSLRRLTCFEEHHEIFDEIKLNFFQYIGTKFNQWFTDERRILDLYHENLFMATRDSKDKKCGNSKCAGFFYNNNNQVARAQCPHCQFQQCQQCCRKWHNEHTNMNCEQYAEWLKDNDPDDPEVQLIKYLNTAGMICPNEKCKAVYEYQPGGCEHFSCPTCKTEFCRICSALFYNPLHNTICPRANCGMKKTLHAHCFLNCYREIRDAEVDEIIRLLAAHKINAAEQLREKPQATDLVCPVEGCTRAPSVTCENRFCDTCYKQFLCLLVWRNKIEPWDLHTDNNLRQKLTGAGVAVPANATRAAIIALAKQHLTQFLGEPKGIPRIRQS